MELSQIMPQTACNSAFRGWIDSPAPGWQPHTRIAVRGWCYHRQGITITAIRVRAGFRQFAGTYGLLRPDVARAYAGEPGSEYCGYEIAATLFPRAGSLQVEARLADGSWHAVQALALTAPLSAFVSDLGRWPVFWCRAALGWPSAWQGFSPSDHDIALIGVRSHGWLNLDLQPQYSPRPVVPERFPAARVSPLALPRLSIVTPSFQQCEFLEQTMRSVLVQEGVDIEYVVQDGGSTDGSLDIIRRLASGLRFWESGADSGQAEAIVRGFARSSGGPDDLMMYLNSDDLLAPGAARFVAEYFARHPQVDVVYGHRVVVDESGAEIGRWFTPRAQFDDLTAHDFVPQETLFWRRRIWDAVGGIDPSFNYALDWDLLLRFRKAGARFSRLPWFLGCFRVHPAQKTTSRLAEDGVPEMAALRHRHFSGSPTDERLHQAMRRAQVDSALVCAAFRYGVRL